MSVKEAEGILRRGGVSPTPNRLLVVSHLLESQSPLSLTELEQRLDTLDKSSIFRVLSLLANRDLVHAIEDGRGIAKYELCHANHTEDLATDDDLHYHFYCTECQRTFCLPDMKIPELQVPEGFHVRGANFMLKGICPDCS